MGKNNSIYPHDPRNLASTIFNLAKRYWGFSLSFKIGATLIGIIVVAVGWNNALFPFVQMLLAIAAELIQLRSDFWRGKGENLKRKLEYFDGFGWMISRSEMSDTLANISASARNKIEQSVQGQYFASQQPKGKRRALENLLESSWWSKNLSGSMFYLGLTVVITLTFSSISGLYLSTISVNDGAVRESISKVVASILSLVISLGMLRLVIGYWNFHSKAETIERSTAYLLEQPDIDEITVLKQLHEYQIARASAPPIPNWLWERRKAVLNNLWDKYRKL